MIEYTIYDKKIVKRYDELVYDMCYEHWTIDNPLSELTMDDGFYYEVENGVTIGFMIDRLDYILEDLYNITRGERHESFYSEVGKLKRLINTLHKKYDLDYVVAKYDFETEKKKRELIKEWFGFKDNYNINAVIDKFEKSNIMVTKENKDLICDYHYEDTWVDMFNWIHDEDTPWEITQACTKACDYEPVYHEHDGTYENEKGGYYFFYALNY